MNKYIKKVAWKNNGMMKSGLFVITLLIVSLLYLSVAVSVKAQETGTKPDVLTLLNGKEHPYIFINEEYAEKLLALRNNPYYSDAFSWVENQARKPLPDSQPANGILSSNISMQLEAKAFLYALGLLSEKDAIETVEYTIEYIKNAKTSVSPSNTIALYKDYGNNAIQTGALVYDWCYDIMSSKQRKELAQNIRKHVYAPEQPCRPDNVETWTDVAGKAAGQPRIYNSIAALALYDIYPEIYNAVMPKVLGSMAQAAQLYGTVGALSDGSIAYTRDYYAYFVGVMIDRLGYDHKDFYGNQINLGYKMLYSRTPFGALIAQGDDGDHRSYIIGQYTNKSETKYDMSILSAMYEEPYLKFQYIKENYHDSSLFALLLMASETEPKLPDDLPLAFKAGYPRSEILARTSWQDGLDAPTVTAYMNMHNRRSGDHDHAQIGDFQLYYKGPLTRAAGIYTGGNWGSDHWRNYLARSVSANCLTVYDPNEVFSYGANGEKIAEANDGGQKMATYKHRLDANMADDNLVAKTEATFIGPNKNTPAFSYIKGDLTNAYSDSKMESYKRAMVFMDTFNEEYPGILVVYDRVISKNKDFTKKWLLQAVTEPVIEDNKTVITNTEDGCSGKLVNVTLYPQNAVISKVGGVGVYMSDGVDRTFPHEESMSDSYVGGWRCEVSPELAATEDVFLNAMYVTDAGNTIELPVTSVNTDEFMGVIAADRQVMFSRNGERISTAFSLDVAQNGYEEMLCFITDIAAGKWVISGSGTSIVVEADEEGSCLTFAAQPGRYMVVPAASETEVTDKVWEEAEKEKIGDFAVKVDTMYAYVKNPNRLVDGKPYIAIADFMERFCGASAETNSKKLIITLQDGRKFTFTAGSKEYVMESNHSSTAGTLSYEPFLDVNGVFYMNCTGVSAKLGFNMIYTEKAKVLKFVIYQDTQLEGVDPDTIIWPAAITASSDDGNVPDNTIDRNLNTRWSSVVADGEWICFDLGEEKQIDSVQIAFYNGAQRNWLFDIQISDDGVNYADILSGQQSCGTSINPEKFMFPDNTRARYVRYVGHGVNNSANGAFIGYYSSITEFIINGRPAESSGEDNNGNDNDNKNDDKSRTSQGGETTTDRRDTKSPQTGEGSYLTLWIALLFIGGILSGAAVFGRKKRGFEKYSEGSF